MVRQYSEHVGSFNNARIGASWQHIDMAASLNI
jgi:hypothetical protein